MNNRGALAGIRVIDLTINVLGPLATQILGDIGADVIKVESPAGDTTRWIGPSRSPGMGPLFLGLNRSKRSVAVELKTPEGREFALKLLATADVMIQNLRPASMSRLGLSYEAVSALNPRIIYCSAYGYGEEGPYAGRPAYDDLIQGSVAIPSLMARASGAEPRYVPLNIADRMVGLNAVFSIGMALFNRERTGRGQRIDLPMFETMTSTVLSEHLYGEPFDPPLAPPGYVRLLSPNRRPHRTKDGYICALVYNDGQWDRFLSHLGRADVKADARFKDLTSRNAHIDHVYEFLGGILAQHTTAEWLESFQRLDIPALPLYTPENLLQDPHLQAVGMFEWTEHPSEGRIRSVRVPGQWSDTPPAPSRPAPLRGQHSVELLEETGYSPEEIERMVAKGAVLDGRPRR
jgi:crotonobetainyl-CoA:carnitine CoA-transferase CaiB-like acyl-CoA transferase